jgi:DNA-binding NarL/FixJ family response regulator
MRLFIADDSKLLRDRLVELLASLEGIEIIGQAKDTIEAIESIQRLKPQVVVLDIRMPKGNGIKVLEAIKKDEQPPVVIIFTNYPYSQYRKKCRDAGADFFFDKSSEYEKLIETVKALNSNFPQVQ